VGSSAALSIGVEEDTWQETLNGSRLPAPVMAGSLLKIIPPVMTAEEFRSGSKESCLQWRNEQVTGMQLVHLLEGPLLEEPLIFEEFLDGWEYDGEGMIRPG